MQILKIFENHCEELTETIFNKKTSTRFQEKEIEANNSKKPPSEKFLASKKEQ